MNEPFLPPKTASKLAEPIPKGQRHTTAREIALAMLGNGWAEAVVLTQLVTKFPELPEKELRGVIEWCARQKPTPSLTSRRFAHPQITLPSPPREQTQSPLERAQWWLRSQTVEPDTLAATSPLTIPVTPVQSLRLVLEQLYLGADNLNIVCSFEQREPGKASPKGPGRVLTRDKWLDYLDTKGVPESQAGAWLRPNPVQGTGTGAAGSITDSDVAAFRFLLLESDVLPLNVQLALYSKLKLPLAAVLQSGGVSAHAWLRVDADNAETYDSIARRLLALLRPFGIDPANKNPSRLSRLPGAKRVIGACDGGLQRLLCLNPACPALKEDDLRALEARLLVPCVEDKPFRQTVLEAVGRYEWMLANRGRLGVPTGFPQFDKASGGLKPNGYTLIAAQTGFGKTTLALNIINHALKNDHGVCLFTLEMTRENIVDMLFCLNASVDRNHFNTGEFTVDEITAMTRLAPRFANLPLWVDDQPDITCAYIEQRTLQLRSENRINLVVVDYAQLVGAGVPFDNREQEVGHIALQLRLTAMRAKVPFLVLSQLNDEGRVRESRRLAHEATTLFRLAREGKEPETPLLMLCVDKGRFIPSKPIPLYFKAEHCRITERSPVDANDVPSLTQQSTAPETRATHPDP